jgi:hypothetical protein
MTTLNEVPAETACLPADLRLSLGEECLLRLAFDAVHGVTLRVSPPGAGPEQFRPQMVCTLLCYCYAAGICGSKEIERAARTDRIIAYICAGSYPDSTILRRFRRAHREVLCRCLTQLLAAARALKAGETAAEPPGLSSAVVADQVSRAARRRIDEACLIDAAEDDC